MKGPMALFFCVLLTVCLYECEGACELMKCMRKLFVCKRYQLARELERDCCKEYQECFSECRNPPRNFVAPNFYEFRVNLMKLLPEESRCVNYVPPGKRGSWNKRNYGSDMLSDILAGY